MKCLVFGLGQAGLAALGLLHDRGWDIVGAYSRQSHLGADIGALAGSAANGRLVQPLTAFAPRSGLADIALFFTTSAVEDLLGAPLACLEAGINVLTIAELAFHPWVLAPDIAARLDTAARTGGCTLSATGVNDTVMCHLPAVVAGIVPRADRVAIEVAGNFGALGPATLAVLPLGLTANEFAASQPGEEAPAADATTCGQVLRALAAMGGFDITALSLDVAPIFTASAIAVPTIGRTIDAGLTSGLLETARATTRQGPVLEVRLFGKLFEPHDEEYLRVEIDGPVPIRLDLRPLPSIETTAAIAVGRAPDVIASPPGFISADRLATAIWRASPFPD